MSEADRVFSRMTTPGRPRSAEDKQFLHVTSRRHGGIAGQSRVVEVVHRRSSGTAAPAEPAPAASWPEGDQGRPAMPLLPAEDPAPAQPPAAPVGHLMPGWEPLLRPVQPLEPADRIPAGMRPRPPAARPEGPAKRAASTRRAFADPFAADDGGANCIRCGYLVSPAREKRGLTTCARCR